MSTSYIVERSLRHLMAALELEFALVLRAVGADDVDEWRIYGPSSGEMLFQGNLERCSDFVCGFACRAGVQVKAF